MDDISSKVCTVYDYGENLALARRLAQEFGTLNYFCPWKSNYPETTRLAIGTGYNDIVRVRHFGDVIHSTDLFVFPWIYDGDIQHDLEMRGKRVWGSRFGDRLEYDRPFFLEALEECGLSVPNYKVCHGIDELEDYLSDGKKRWIKLNNRGDGETWCSKTPEQTKRRIEAYRHRWGPIANDIVFTVVDHIETDLEAAYDGFHVTSPQGSPQFPNIGFLGYENKSRSHILRAIPYDDFPKCVRSVNDAFAPMLAKYFVRGAFGTEIKLLRDKKTKEETSYFLDATIRQPDPPGPAIMEQVTNLGEFFWHGAQGELVPLEIDEEFAVQVNICSEHSKTNTCPVEFPEELDQWIKLNRCCFRNGVNQILPEEEVTTRSAGPEQVGAVVGLGSTIDEAIDKAKEICDEINGDVTCEVESLMEVLKRIHEGKKQDIPFAEEVPKPEEVIADA